MILLCVWACASTPYPQGKTLYTLHCENCHMEDGTGLARLIPPLAGADYLTAAPDMVPCLIRYGREKGVVVNGVAYTEPMPGVAELTPTQITNIVNYIRTSWENDLKPVTLQEVQEALDRCQQ